MTAFRLGLPHVSAHNFRSWYAVSITINGNPKSNLTKQGEEFLERVGDQLENIRPVNVQEGTRAVFHVLSRHLDRGQAVKVRDALPEDIRRTLWPEWPENFLEEAPSRQQAAPERTAKPH